MNPETGDTDIKKLLADSGPRLEASQEARQRVQEHLLEVWQQLPNEEETLTAKGDAAGDPRAPTFYAIAAALGVAAIGAWLGWSTLQETAEPVANIAFATSGYIVTPESNGSPSLFKGATVKTSEQGRLLLSLDTNTSIRLDQNTRATLRSSNEVYLHSGRLYVDSHGGNNAVRITTANGFVTKVGTQFEVQVSDDVLEVAVREGQIKVDRNNTQTVASAGNGLGEVIRYDANGGQSKSTVATTDPMRWHWTQLTRPNFDMTQGNYYEYLQWAARERGLTLHFADPILTRLAKSETGKGRHDATDADIEGALRTSKYLIYLPGAQHELWVGER